MSVVCESPHVARPSGAQSSVDSRLRPPLPIPARRAQPVVIVGTHLGVSMGFHHVLQADTEHLVRLPVPDDLPRLERAQDAQYRLQELLSQMRALEMEVEQSTGGTQAGRASVNAQLEQLAAEAQDVANLVRFDDVHRMTSTAVDTVTCSRADTHASVRRTLLSREVFGADEAWAYQNAAATPGANPQQTRTVARNKPERDNFEVRERRIEHARQVMQRLLEHLDNQGIAYVAAQNYVPVGAALATLYAQLEHQSAWRPPKIQAAASATPVGQTFRTRYI